jgi:TRAP-type C4-dicarboxylate transport system permease small subunit
MKLKARGQKILKISSSIFTLAICGTTAYYSFAYVIDRLTAGATTSNLLIPIWIFAVILLISFIILTLAIFLKLICTIADYSWIGNEDTDIVDV